MTRVKAAIWVAAFVRRVNASGDAFAVVAERGAEEAGAVFVRVDRLDGTGDLYVPAPQTLYESDRPDDRRFVARFPEGPQPQARLDEAIQRERRIDPDLWLVAVDDRKGRHFLEDALIPQA
jgi:hypothetical protein